MVSRMRAFTIAAVWIAGALALGVVAISATTEGETGGLLWAVLLLATGLAAAALWIVFGNQRPRSSAGLGGQAALIGLATATALLLLVLVVGQMAAPPG